MVTKTTLYKSGYDKNLTFYNCNLNNKTIPSIFIHGVGLDISMWDKQKKFFKKNFLYYDLINHGKTKKVLKKLTYENYNSQLKALINYFNLKKINLIGYSIGSIIALNFSIKNKKLVNKLVLISSVYKRSAYEKKLVKSRYNSAIKEKSISKKTVNRWFTEKYLMKNFKTYNKFYSLLENNKKNNFLPAYNLFANSNNLKYNFKHFNIPTLLITGEKDYNSTPKMSLQLNKEIKNSKLKIVSKAKHMAIYEKAHIVNREIKNFLK